MKIQFVKYVWILSTLFWIMSCTNHNSVEPLKSNRIVIGSNKNRMNSSFLSYSIFDYDSQKVQVLSNKMRLCNFINHQINNTKRFSPLHIRFSIYNQTKDSIEVLEVFYDDYFADYLIPLTYNSKDKIWNKSEIKYSVNGFENQVLNNKSLSLKWLDLKKIQDSMMFRYFFRTSKFKDSLMYHDVYFTFKNDSFIIVRQTENEK